MVTYPAIELKQKCDLKCNEAMVLQIGIWPNLDVGLVTQYHLIPCVTVESTTTDQPTSSEVWDLGIVLLSHWKLIYFLRKYLIGFRLISPLSYQ